MPPARRRSDSSYDSESWEAKLATIIANQKAQDKERWDYQKTEGEYRAIVLQRFTAVESAQMGMGLEIATIKEQLKQKPVWYLHPIAISGFSGTIGAFFHHVVTGK